MQPDKLKLAIAEAERFLIKAKAITIKKKFTIHGDKYEIIDYPSPVNAACKRASLDLARALSELRKP